MVRRILTFTMFSVWWLVTLIAGYRLLVNCIDLPEGFRDYYVTFSSAVTIAIGFYFKGRNGTKKEENDN
jgi:hypothetical protein